MSINKCNCNGWTINYDEFRNWLYAHVLQNIRRFFFLFFFFLCRKLLVLDLIKIIHMRSYSILRKLIGS
jgi:hypothetical protein